MKSREGGENRTSDFTGTFASFNLLIRKQISAAKKYALIKKYVHAYADRQRAEADKQDSVKSIKKHIG